MAMEGHCSRPPIGTKVHREVFASVLPLPIPALIEANEAHPWFRILAANGDVSLTWNAMENITTPAAFDFSQALRGNACGVIMSSLISGGNLFWEPYSYLAKQESIWHLYNSPCGGNLSRSATACPASWQPAQAAVPVCLISSTSHPSTDSEEKLVTYVDNV